MITDHPLLLLPACQSAKRSFKEERDRFLYVTNEVNAIKGSFYFSHKDLNGKEPTGCEVHFMVLGDNNIPTITSKQNNYSQ